MLIEQALTHTRTKMAEGQFDACLVISLYTRRRWRGQRRYAN